MEETSDIQHKKILLNIIRNVFTLGGKVQFNLSVPVRNRIPHQFSVSEFFVVLFGYRDPWDKKVAKYV